MSAKLFDNCHQRKFIFAKCKNFTARQKKLIRENKTYQSFMVYFFAAWLVRSAHPLILR